MSDWAVVTGGSAGIGRAICETLLGEGRRVVSLDRSPAGFSDPRLTTIEVDLADREATRTAAAEVAALYAPTTLVHNAGVIRPALLGLARTWALELAGDGITVNVVAPGPIRTDMFYDVVQQGSDKERAPRQPIRPAA